MGSFDLLVLKYQLYIKKLEIKLSVREFAKNSLIFKYKVYLQDRAANKTFSKGIYYV